MTGRRVRITSHGSTAERGRTRRQGPGCDPPVRDRRPGACRGGRGGVGRTDFGCAWADEFSAVEPSNPVNHIDRRWREWD